MGKLCDLGTIGLACANRNSDTINVIVGGLRTKCGITDPIIMDRQLLPFVDDRGSGSRLQFIDGHQSELPPTYWCIALQTTTAAMPAPDLIVCVACVKNGWLKFGLVVAPALHPYPFVTHGGCGRCYSWDGTKHPAVWHLSTRPLSPAGQWRHQASYPALTAGVIVVTGAAPFAKINGTNTLEAAASALLVQEYGGIAQCLDGSRIPWQSYTLPPLLLAAGDNVAARARAFASRRGKFDAELTKSNVAASS